jgi:hypothetical protein
MIIFLVRNKRRNRKGRERCKKCIITSSTYFDVQFSPFLKTKRKKEKRERVMKIF